MDRPLQFRIDPQRVGLVLAAVAFRHSLGRQGRTKTLALLILSGGLYVAGAEGAERLSPSGPATFSGFAYAVGGVSFEEGLEVAGVIVVICGLLDAPPRRSRTYSPIATAASAPRPTNRSVTAVANSYSPSFA